MVYTVNMYIHEAIGINLSNSSFPWDHSEDEASKFHRCTSFGEAASIGYESDSASKTVNFFRAFYYAFTKENIIWYAYDDSNNHFESPSKFNFSGICIEPYNIDSFKAAICPCILPVNFCGGRSVKLSYEFYVPSRGGKDHRDVKTRMSQSFHCQQIW